MLLKILIFTVITKNHLSSLKTSLTRSLDLVLRRQPAILLSGGVPDPRNPGISKPWKDLIQDLIPSKSDEARAALMLNGDILSGSFNEKDEENNLKVRLLREDQRILRKKMFVMLTAPKKENLEG